MVYSNKFVAVIKCNGKILREVTKENDVILPFGAEYSILLKNLDDRRAVVEVSIDGSDVLNGRRLVIDANKDTELKGVMVDNAVKNAFKFIQKTKKIQDHRGDKIDDGFIRIKFGFERQLESTTTWTSTYTYPTLYRSFFHQSDIKYGDFNEGPTCKGGEVGSSRRITGPSDPVVCANISSNVTMDSLGQCEVPQAEEGITVPGSELKQDFNSTHVGTIEDNDVIIIRLKGTDKIDKPVKMPLFVSTKFECPTCGTKSRHGVKYCPECGTNIQVTVR